MRNSLPLHRLQTLVRTPPGIPGAREAMGGSREAACPTRSEAPRGPSGIIRGPDEAGRGEGGGGYGRMGEAHTRRWPGAAPLVRSREAPIGSHWGPVRPTASTPMPPLSTLFQPKFLFVSINFPRAMLAALSMLASFRHWARTTPPSSPLTPHHPSSPPTSRWDVRPPGCGSPMEFRGSHGVPGGPGGSRGKLNSRGYRAQDLHLYYGVFPPSRDTP